MSDRTVDVWGERTPYEPGEPWPVRVDQHLAAGVDAGAVRWTPSACVLCSNGCGLDIGVLDGRIVGVRGERRTASTTAVWGRRGRSPTGIPSRSSRR